MSEIAEWINMSDEDRLVVIDRIAMAQDIERQGSCSTTRGGRIVFREKT